MLFERQKLLLSFVDAFGGQVQDVDFQKLLFLFTQEYEETASYEFVPYKMGCFSFTSYADKRKLIAKDCLTDDDGVWQLTEAGRSLARQHPKARASLERFRKRYGELRGDRLIGEVYRRYPYFAIKSEIVDAILDDPKDRKRVERARPAARPAGLLTIGYEGKSLEAYLNLMLEANVTVLCDVRRNALSRKYGFSKKTLSHACQNLGIRYEHLPELGIASSKRQALNCQDDYERLFAAYEKDTLRHQSKAIHSIRDWIDEANERVALTCYEKDPRQCHRTRVAKAVEAAAEDTLRTEHL